MKPKSFQSATGIILGTLAMGMLVACGSGSVGDPGVADGGIRGTGSSVGPVSGFGSVFVNGIEFSTDQILNGAVNSDDGITLESQLSEGMILRVEGAWRDDGQGTAESLSYDDTLRGPINEILPDPSGAGEFVTLTIMGQRVRVDNQTVVRGTTFASLLGGAGAGEYVRVSAWRQTDGLYRAGYVGTVTENLFDVELEGDLFGVDTDLDQFTIGTGPQAITVRYGDDAVFASGLTEADLFSANALEVEGSLAGNLLTASSIDRDDGRRFAREGADDIQFTATIDTPYLADDGSALPGEFTMGGLTVRVTTNTELDGGLLLSDLQTDLLVQVEGNFVSDTVVEAEEIELREGNSKVEGVIVGSPTLTPLRQFVVGGVTVRMTALTILTRDDGDEQTFASLVNGTRVEVEGIERGEDGAVYIEALKVEVDSDQEEGEAPSEFELEGRLQAITEFRGSISVLGVTMSDLQAEYDVESDSSTSARNIIVNAAKSGAVVLEVEYANTTAGYEATEIELEAEDND